MKRSFTIRDLPKTERPRERLQKFGSEALSAQEILVLILGRGIGGESVMITAQRLLSKFGNLKGIADASIEELSRIKGIGIAKATQLKAVFELGKRVESYVEPQKKTIVKTPEDVIKLVKSKLRGKKKEHFIAVLLNTRNQCIGIPEISIGSLNANIVHPREVFKEAISASAASCIFVHNHPSGDPTPSEDDRVLNKRLVKTGETLGIDVLDHIIVTDKDFLSMKDKNFM